jgi:PEP-CTERM motif
MRRLLLTLTALALAAMPASSAFADTFNFTFFGPAFSGNGTFTATEIGASDLYNVTGVSGTVTPFIGPSTSITGVLAPGSFLLNDNILTYPPVGPAFFDAFGVAFSLENGNDVKLFDLLGEGAVGGSSPFIIFDLTEPDFVGVEKAASPVPEPGSLALIGTGVLGLAGALRRRIAA